MQCFRFLDLPRDNRLIIYDELMDNKKNDLKYSNFRGFDIDYAYIDQMYYPAVLRVSKLVNDEYWSLYLGTLTLWIMYDVSESIDDTFDGEPVIPLLSEWIRIPEEVLAKITDLVSKFEARWEFPKFNPFLAMEDCVVELPNLKHFGIWSEFEVSLVDFSRDQTEKDALFQMFVEGIVQVELALDDYQEETEHHFVYRIDCKLYTPLYEMNKHYRHLRRRHLEQGVAPLEGLPKWGYSVFKVVPPWVRPSAISNPYHGEELVFERVEHGLPVMPRSETEVDSPSEFDYEFDESGWGAPL